MNDSRARFALAALCLATAFAQPARAGDDHAGEGHGGHGHAAPITVKVIGFNDYHGNLQTPGTFGVNTIVPAAQRPAVGGAEYIAAYVARLKAQNPLNEVVGEPAVETLNKVGVEFTSVGNHEFDKGAAELKRLQAGGCKITNGLPHPN